MHFSLHNLCTHAKIKWLNSSIPCLEIRTWPWGLMSHNNSGWNVWTMSNRKYLCRSVLPGTLCHRQDWCIHALSATQVCIHRQTVWLRGNNSTKWQKICPIVGYILFCLRTFPLWLVGLLFLMSFKSCENQPTLITANLWQQPSSHPDAEVAGGDAVGFKSPPM